MRHWVPSYPFQHHSPNILCPLRVFQGYTDINKHLQRLTETGDGTILLHYYEFTRAWALLPKATLLYSTVIQKEF